MMFIETKTDRKSACESRVSQEVGGKIGMRVEKKFVLALDDSKCFKGTQSRKIIF